MHAAYPRQRTHASDELWFLLPWSKLNKTHGNKLLLLRQRHQTYMAHACVLMSPLPAGFLASLRRGVKEEKEKGDREKKKEVKAK